MKPLPKSQILRFTEKAINLARRAVSRYSSEFSKHRYTLPQHVVLLCLKVRKNTTSRGLLDELIEMPHIRRVLGLAELPAPSTLCKAFNRLDMAVWRIILTLSATLLPTSGVVGVDASGFDRSHASKHYTKRAELTIQQLKVTLLVDTKVNAILDQRVIEYVSSPLPDDYTARNLRLRPLSRYSTIFIRYRPPRTGPYARAGCRIRRREPRRQLWKCRTAPRRGPRSCLRGRRHGRPVSRSSAGRVRHRRRSRACPCSRITRRDLGAS